MYEVKLFSYYKGSNEIAQFIKGHSFYDHKLALEKLEDLIQDNLDYNWQQRETENRRGVMISKYSGSSSFLFRDTCDKFWCEVEHEID